MMLTRLPEPELMNPSLRALCDLIAPMLPNASEASDAVETAGLLTPDIAEFAIKRHRVGGMLYQAANARTATMPEDLDPHVQAVMTSHYHDNVRRQLAQRAMQSRVLAEFERRGIAAIPFKGQSLSAQLYPVPNLRTARDVDVLVGRDQFIDAARALLSLGFIPRRPAHKSWISRSDPACFITKEMAFQDEKTGDLFELHHRLFAIEPQGFAQDFIQAVNHTGTTSGPSTTNTVYGLYIILHGARCFWSRLKWVVDLAFLLDAMNSPQREQTIALARRYRCEPALWASIVLTDMCFPCALDEDWIDRVRVHRSETFVLRLLGYFCRTISGSNPNDATRPPAPPVLHEPRGLIFQRAVSWPSYVGARGHAAILRRRASRG